MLSVSTMALAAMIGSACVPNANQACNVNSCTYDQANCIQGGVVDPAYGIGNMSPLCDDRSHVFLVLVGSKCLL